MAKISYIVLESKGELGIRQGPSYAPKCGGIHGTTPMLTLDTW